MLKLKRLKMVKRKNPCKTVRYCRKCGKLLDIYNSGRICEKCLFEVKYCRKCCKPLINAKEFLCKRCLKKTKLLNERIGLLRIRFKVFNRDNFTCQYCGRNVKDHNIVLEIDHVRPFSKNGKDKISNFKTSCFDCNRGKGDILLNKKYYK